jgi:hypothetical protein
MQDLSMLACASEPGGNGGLPKAKDPLGSRRIQSFGQRREYHCDQARWGFQPVQGRVASGAERGAARRTSERLDLLGTTVLAIPDQRMEESVSVAKVLALRVRTSEPFGRYAFGCSSAAFHLAPGAHRRRRRLSTRRGCGGETTGRTVVWAARLELTGEPAANLGGCFRRDRSMMRKAVGTQ